VVQKNIVMLLFYKFSRFFIVFIATGCFTINISVAQVFAPASNRATVTDYYFAAEQDSIFVFFNPGDIKLRAQFSDSSAAAYKWYRYNNTVPYESRFQVIEDATDSVLTNISRGGYLVEVKNIAIDSIETYTCWVFVDNVKVEKLEVVRNSCKTLELMLSTTPNFFDIPSLFSYYDISQETHQEINVLGTKGYFANHTFTSINSEVDVPGTLYTLPFINVEFINDINGATHGPLVEASYELTINPPFGKMPIVVTTPSIPAVSTKADFEISFWNDENQSFGSPETGEMPKGEALLEIMLKSTTQNSDSIYWNILNDKLRLAKGADSIIWRDSSLFAERIESYPDKKRLKPGFYNIEHISVKNTSGLPCIDTVYKIIEVDTSFVQNIPNVFTPGALYSHFKIAPDDLQSLKSFKIVIHSRSGQQVYKYAGDPKNWEGWNGKLDNTKGDLPTGVYYYVIDAVGWDGVRYRNGHYKGFLHLYR